MYKVRIVLSITHQSTDSTASTIKTHRHMLMSNSGKQCTGLGTSSNQRILMSVRSGLTIVHTGRCHQHPVGPTHIRAERVENWTLKHR